MVREKPVGAAAVLGLLAMIGTGARPAAPVDLAAVLEPIRRAHRLPALAAMVLRDGKVVARGAVGLRKAGWTTPVTIDDRFHIGSCTKSMTATLVAMLVDQG